MELEPELLYALEKIKKADHLVWIHPVWWGGLPALMKSFIDQIFYQKIHNALIAFQNTGNISSGSLQNLETDCDYRNKDR